MSCPKLATDIIIEHDLGIVLVERLYKPFGLAIPGGHAEIGITLEENAIKEAKEETGLDVIITNDRHPMTVRSEPDRDPRYHMVTAVYIGKGEGKPIAGSDAKRIAIFSPYELMNVVKTEPERFAFGDHPDILEEYLRKYVPEVFR